MTDWSRLQAELRGSFEHRRGLLLGLDFDGTLAEIVDVPARASLSPATRRLLAAVAARPDVRVAVLSGRALDDVAAKVRRPDVFVAGDHGLRIRGPGLRWRHGAARAFDPALRARLESAARRFPGALLEDKGIGVAVNYRRVARGSAPRLVAALTAAARPAAAYRVIHSRKTFDVRAAAAWDKGNALDLIAERLPGRWRRVFVGDDRTDEEAFRTLGRDAITVRIGTPAETAARYAFADRAVVGRLLRTVAALSQAATRRKTLT